MPSDTEFPLSFRIRAAVPEDGPALIRPINSAFSVETFLQDPRTDELRLAAAMEKGTILVGEVVVEDDRGQLLASIYTRSPHPAARDGLV
jgi:hypothetical protein